VVSAGTAGIGLAIDGEFAAHITRTALLPAKEPFDIGSSFLPVRQIYTDQSVVTLEAEVAKRDVQPLDDRVLDAWQEVGFHQYRKVDGGADRITFGLIAERILNAFARHGLDPWQYSLLVRPEGPSDQPARLTKSDGRDKSAIGIRYDQALLLEIALLQRRLARR
jgi:hypothetical protein